jgi:hypothetical protein
MVSDHLKGAWAQLISSWLDILSAFMTVREDIPLNNVEEELASVAVVAASDEALHLCRAKG